MLKQVLFIAFIYIVEIQSELTEVILINQDQLQGVRNPDADQFLGIPYAVCPERFAPVNGFKTMSLLLVVIH